MEFKGLIIYSIIYLVLFVSIEIAYNKYSLKTELTRKIIHISSGLIALTFPFFFDDFISVIILCSLFLVILYLSSKFDLLHSIHNVERVTLGSVLFPIIVCFSFWSLTQEKDYVFYYGPLLILALSDPAAAFAGKKFKFVPYEIFGNTKTLAGNIGFFVTSFIICYAVSYISYRHVINPFFTSLIIAILTTIAEGVSVKGYDNVTVPITALGAIYFIRYVVLQ